MLEKGMLLFPDEAVKSSNRGAAVTKYAEEPAWKIMVIDDNHDIHSLTKMVLKEFVFENRPLEFLDGYSGADARSLMKEHPDTAIILLDVVMETDQEGLKVVQFIRDELKNPFVRIVLRTGQAGHAPEAKVISEYDVNDYMDKVNITDQRLHTTITTSLRAFNLLRTVENTRTGLKKIIEATSHLYEQNSLGTLATGILTQLAALISYDEGSTSENAAECFAATKKRGSINIYAAFGKYEPHIGKPVFAIAPPDAASIIKRALKEKKSLFTDHDFLGYFRTKNGMENLIYLKINRPLKVVDRDLIEVFASNIASAFENLFLNREITKSQKDVTFTLGEIIETRSGDAGQHVRRVAESSRLLAQLAGLSDVECELLRTASPMHDLGKVGIPDSVLNKPGKLLEEEWQLMQSHTEIGCKVLENTDQPIIKTGGIICNQHHEKWDGSGYPQGLAGEDIHIFARITAIIDVFDALTHSRVYKEAWSVEKALDQIKKDRGTHFDPTLADLFLDNIDDFFEIQKAFKN
jgi:response regulator RpfG family c-di-GMP phosphodiesterase